MQKWEYMGLIQIWNKQLDRYYWGDDATDGRNTIERLNALGKEGWEVVSAYKSGRSGEHYNYLLKRTIE